MKLPRELKMTTICKSCDFQYGSWRLRCPTCGTMTPEPVRESFNAPREVKPRTSPRRTRLCVFCHLRAKKVTCPQCNEPVHQSCLSLHEPQCKQFQLEREDAEQQLLLTTVDHHSGGRA